MSKRIGIPWFVAVLLVLAALACNIPGFGGTGTPPPETPGDVVDTTPLPQGEPDDEPAATDAPASTIADCPEPGEGTLLYVSEEQGFCLLYPDNYQVNPEWWVAGSNSVAFIGSPLDTSSMEPVLVILRVSFNGPLVHVNTPQEYAAKWQEIYTPFDVSEGTDMTIGGQPATLVRNIPSRLAEQTAFIIANGYRYTVTIQPQPGDIPDLTAEVEATWATATGSIVFFEPSVTPDYLTAEEVCPQATPDTQLHVNLGGGYCYLVPADAERDEMFESGYTLGPVLGSMEGIGEVRARAVFAAAGPAQGQTPRELLAGFIEAGVDETTFEDATIGGAPAVIYVDTRGPIPSRIAQIVARDRVYTFVANPYPADAFPAASEPIEQLWTTTIESVAFFDPWQ